jgi:PAS domain S-box-containing protein
MLREGGPSALFFLAVIISAWMWGRGPSLIAACLSLVAVAAFTAGEHSGTLLFLRLCMFAAVSGVVIMLASRDVSERVRQRENFRTLIESAPDAIVGVDAAGRIALVNSQAEQLFGYTRSELLGQSIEILVPESQRAKHAAHRDSYDRHPRVRPMGAAGMPLTGRRKDGSEFPAEISLSPIRTKGGLLVTSIIRDISERVQAEAQRAELIREQAARTEAELAQQRFRELVQDLNAIVWEMDVETRQLTFVSKRAQELLGYPLEHWLARGNGWMEHIHPEDHSRVDQLLQAMKDGTVEYRAIAADGRELWLRLNAHVARDAHDRPRQLRGLTVDFTEHRNAEAAMQTSEKLTATLRLAATLAHEINNPVGGVTNLLYLIESSPSSDEQIRSYARLAQGEIKRVAHITRQMLAFYRDSSAASSVDVSRLLNSTLELYRPQLRDRGIAVDVCSDQSTPIQAFPGELRQVISNLLLNAIEATGNGGRIRIKVSTAQDWANPARQGIRITFVDNGTGIAPEHRQHIFEPFFSTKGENGTGLGLWVSDGLIRKHGGTIRTHSSIRAGHSGTAVSVFVPFETKVAVIDLRKARAAKRVG